MFKFGERVVDYLAYEDHGILDLVKESPDVEWGGGPVAKGFVTYRRSGLKWKVNGPAKIEMLKTSRLHPLMIELRASELFRP